MSNTHHQIPCLKRKFLTKFWMKMIQPDDQGQISGQETVDNMTQTIAKYKAIMDKKNQEIPSPFQRISQTLKNKKGMMSREEMLDEYLRQMQKDLMENFQDTKSMSSSSSSYKERYENLAGESQDSEDMEISIEDLFGGIKDVLKEKIARRKSASENSQEL